MIPSAFRIVLGNSRKGGVLLFSRAFTSNNNNNNNINNIENFIETTFYL